MLILESVLYVVIIVCVFGMCMHVTVSILYLWIDKGSMFTWFSMCLFDDS